MAYAVDIRTVWGLDASALGVFMNRVPEPNKISVRVPEILGREEADPYPNRKLSGTR